jgi:hypothetical protein
MQSGQLDTLLRAILVTALAGTSLVSCSDPIWDDANYDTVSCKTLLRGLAPQLGVDSIELWQGSEQFTSDKITTKGWSVILADGVECQGAGASSCAADRDKAGHDPAVTSLTQVEIVGMPPNHERVLTTKGGVVKAAGTKDELLAMLGSIDTEEKLLLWYRYIRQGECEVKVHLEADHIEIKTTTTLSDCPTRTEEQILSVHRDGAVEVIEHGEQTSSNVCAGRRPRGLQPSPGSQGDPLGQHFSAMARLEEASVTAFHLLAADLEAIGAPAGLIEGCREAAADEVRHARSAGQLALRFGADLAPAQVAPAGARTARELAVENAIEGCIRETFGALVARHQAVRSQDEEIRAALAIIAEEETRHAALSWRIQGWLEQERSCGGVLTATRAGAFAQLRAEILASEPASPAITGLPDQATALRLLDGLEGALLG